MLSSVILRSHLRSCPQSGQSERVEHSPCFCSWRPEHTEQCILVIRNAPPKHLTAAQSEAKSGFKTDRQERARTRVKIQQIPLSFFHKISKITNLLKGADILHTTTDHSSSSSIGETYWRREKCMNY